MRAILVAALVGLVSIAGAGASAQDSQVYEELVEWVFEPCMGVAAAIDVDDVDSESINMGIKRAHIAMLMLASRDSAIREVSDVMKSGTSWEERRAVYPVLLRQCLAQFGIGG